MDGSPDQPRAERIAGLAHDLRGIGGKLKRRLREQADVGDLTPSQKSTLLLIEKAGTATTSELARLEGMRPQSMGAVIAALESAGLVSGTPDPADGRRTILALTEPCRAWLRDGRAARQDWLARTIAARLAPAEQDALIAVVPLLQRLLDD